MFKILIEIVTPLEKSELIEIGGKILSGSIANGSKGYVDIESKRLPIEVVGVAMMNSPRPNVIAFSVASLPCSEKELIGREFISWE